MAKAQVKAPNAGAQEQGQAEVRVGTPVVVTTAHRGVFFGYAPEGTALDGKVLRVERVRMCVYWSADVGGVVGLAAKGPGRGCRVGPPAPAMTIQDVTGVMEATAEAAALWEKGPWS
jgi:hypothetical protein